jgi:hypothetical protein
MNATSGDTVIARTAASTGPRDFGPDASREGLEHTLAGLAKAPYTPAGHGAAIAQAVGHLANRLRIEA